MMMKVTSFVNKHPLLSFLTMIVSLFGYQALTVFWGIELPDSGFHLTAYQNVFDAPDSVSYNFMYYLTTIVGGAIMKMFPALGIVGFRLVGVLFVDLALFIIFVGLKKTVSPIYLLLGATLLVISYYYPYSFNNGILSCFLYVCALILIYHGVIKQKLLYIIISGFLVGLNLFSRMPNIIGCGLTLIVLIYPLILYKEKKVDWRFAIYFALSILLSVCLVLAFMVAIGHFNDFVDSLKVLFFMGSAGDHSIVNLILSPIFTYFNLIAPFGVCFTLFFFIKKTFKNIISEIVFILITSILLFNYAYTTTHYGSPCYFLWVLCLSGCLLNLLKGDGSLRFITVLALCLLLFETLGSDSPWNHGSLPALLAAPLACSSIINKKNVVYVIVICLALGANVIKNGVYGEKGSLFNKKGVINVPECGYLKTTDTRALIMNNSLSDLKEFIQDKDTLMVFPKAPMMNYLTHTRPAGGNSWPTTNGVFAKPLSPLPKVLLHKFSVIDWEDKIYNYSLNPAECNETTGFDLNAFLVHNNYSVVYENDYFVLFYPPRYIKK